MSYGNHVFDKGTNCSTMDLTNFGMSAAAIEAAHSCQEPFVQSIIRASLALDEKDRFRALLLIKALALVSGDAMIGKHSVE